MTNPHKSLTISVKQSWKPIYYSQFLLKQVNAAVVSYLNNSWNHLPLPRSPLALAVYALKVDMVLQRGAIFWTILEIIVHSLAFSSMFGPLVPRVDTVSSPRCAVAPIHNHYHHHKIHICPKNCHFLSCWHHRQFLFWKFIWFCRDIPENPFNV